MKRTLTTPQKLAATVTVLATAGALTAGAFAAWSSTASQHQDLGTAIVSSTLTTQNGNSPWTDIDVTNLSAGEDYTVYGRLTNTGTVQQGFMFLVKGSNGNLTGLGAGMQVMIQTCAIAWDDGDCWGEGAVLGTPLEFKYITDAGVSSPDPVVLDAGGATYLRVDFTLPENTNDSFQGQLERFMVTETGTSTGFTTASPHA